MFCAIFVVLLCVCACFLPPTPECDIPADVGTSLLVSPPKRSRALGLAMARVGLRPRRGFWAWPTRMLSCSRHVWSGFSFEDSFGANLAPLSEVLRRQRHASECHVR
eukprot:7778706-Pyramimonas_sp.AAC.1